MLREQSAGAARPRNVAHSSHAAPSPNVFAPRRIFQTSGCAACLASFDLSATHWDRGICKRDHNRSIPCQCALDLLVLRGHIRSLTFCVGFSILGKLNCSLRGIVSFINKFI